MYQFWKQLRNDAISANNSSPIPPSTSTDTTAATSSHDSTELDALISMGDIDLGHSLESFAMVLNSFPLENTETTTSPLLENINNDSANSPESIEVANPSSIQLSNSDNSFENIEKAAPSSIQPNTSTPKSTNVPKNILHHSKIYYFGRRHRKKKLIKGERKSSCLMLSHRKFGKLII